MDVNFLRRRVRHGRLVGMVWLAGQVFGGVAVAGEVGCKVMGHLDMAWGDAFPSSGLFIGADDRLHGVTNGYSVAYGTYAPAVAFRMTRNGQVSAVGTLPGTPQYQPRAHGQMVDHKGHYYGVTDTGGFWGHGLLYRMQAHGQVTELFDFTKWYDNGKRRPLCPSPQTRLLEAADGKLYGLSGSGCVFRATPGGQFGVVHRFGQIEGAPPFNALMQGSDGLLYGTAQGGGAAGLGTLYSLDAQGVLTVLHDFAGAVADGAHPDSTLVEGPGGVLYGTTSGGGAADHGVVFRLGPDGQFSLLHHFGTGDGLLTAAVGDLLLARDGQLYGVAASGGRHGRGGVYRLTTSGDFSLLQSFGSPDAACAMHTASSGLVEWDDGEFYGTDVGFFDVRLNQYEPGAIYRITVK